MSAAHLSSPPPVHAIAYAASLAEFIIIAASISFIGHTDVAGIQSDSLSIDNVFGHALILASGAKRSTAVSAVKIFAVLAGCTAS
jgi:hypothetical protein